MEITDNEYGGNWETMCVKADDASSDGNMGNGKALYKGEEVELGSHKWNCPHLRLKERTKKVNDILRPWCYSLINGASSPPCRHQGHVTSTNCRPRQTTHSSHINLLHSIQVFWSRLNLVLVVLSLCLVDCTGLSWIQEPRNTAVKVGGDTLIECAGQNGNSSQILQQYFDDGSDRILFISGTRHRAPDNYNARENADGFDLLVSDVKQADDSSIKCEIGNKLEKTVTLTVLVEPGVPQITASSNDLREGSVVTLECSSLGGNPAPSFSWFRDGIQLADMIPPTSWSKFGIAQSDITRTLDLTDHLMEYRCDVNNSIGETTNVTSFNVKYGPRLYLGEFDPLVVVEGSNVSLGCSVDANPEPTSITWRKSAATIGNGADLDLSPVEASDAGSYLCQVEHEIQDASRFIDLHVQYGPKFSFTVDSAEVPGSVVTVREETYLKVECSVDALPAVSVGDIRWLLPGGGFTIGPDLVFDDISRNDAGVYACQATNTLRPSGGETLTVTRTRDITIVVQYPPGRANVIVPSSVVKGDNVILRCDLDTDGVPTAVVKWTRLGGSNILSGERQLEFTSVELSDIGDYVCQPSNDVGDGTSDQKHLNVDEFPEWLDNPLPESMTVNISEDTVVVACRVNGRPSPSITWFRGGEPLDVNMGLYDVEVVTSPINTYSWDVTSTLRLQGNLRSPRVDSLRIEDNADYTCDVSNGLPHPVHAKTMKLAVQYSPVLYTNATKVAINSNKFATLFCQSHSVPITSFTWYNRTTDASMTSNGRVTITESNEPGSLYPHNSRLTITDANMYDLGDYLCYGENMMGIGYPVQIRLTIQSVPEAPYQVKVDSITWESAELSWIPGFNGGYHQNFTVMFISSTSPSGEISTGVTTTFNVTGLKPSSNYTFIIVGVNFLGRGVNSDDIPVTTPDYPVEPPGAVRYNVKSRLLTFETPNSHYCARIEIDQGHSGWELFQPCANPIGDVLEIGSQWKVNDIRVAMCLKQRPDVCSSQELAIKLEDLPVETIIIVACVCGGIVIILTIILIILCWRRYQAKKKYEKDEANRMQQMRAGGTEADRSGGTQTVSGIDNGGMDSPDSADDMRPPVYSTSSSQYPHTPNGTPYVQFTAPQQQSEGHSNGHVPNGQPANWPSNGNLPPYSYMSDQEMNSRNEAREHAGHYPLQHMDQKVNLDNSHLHVQESYPQEPNKDSHHTGSDSGVSTPDPQKPKKVIYEVIV